jgi:hypothetical protein
VHPLSHEKAGKHEEEKMVFMCRLIKRRILVVNRHQHHPEHSKKEKNGVE